jgi:uncharacterized membrane protein YbhN (UPF0104 family)
VKPITELSVLRSIAATFSGATVSLFTPNRVGGFLGRIVYLNAQHRTKAAFVSIFGNFCQLLVTVVVGTIGLAFAVYNSFEFSDLTTEVLTSFMLAGIAVSGMMLFVYFRPRAVVKFVFRFKFLQRFTRHVRVFKVLRRRQLVTVLMFSLLRYVVFTLQFWLVLQAFGVPVNLETGVMLIAIVYLILAIIPSIVLGNLGVRESAVILVIGTVTNAHETLIAASLGIWAINIILPALIGSVLLLMSTYSLFPSRT